MLAMDSGEVVDSTRDAVADGSPFQSEPPYVSESLADQPSAVFATAAFVIVALLGNTMGTVFFWQADEVELILCLAIGAMLAQPCLLAVWIALGYQQVVIRIPSALGILLGLVMSYLQTLHMLDPSDLPLEVTIFFFSVAAAIFVVAQLPFWIFRTASHQVIARVDKSENTASQFGIRHLMITMTIAAVIVLIVKNVIPSGDWEGGAPWMQFIRFVTPYFVGICVLALLCTALVFSQGHRRLLALVIGGVVITGSISLYLMPSNGLVGLSGVGMEIFVRNATLFFLGFSATMIGVLSVYYRIGFRLRKI